MPPQPRAICRTESPDQTRELGMHIGQSLPEASVIALTGQLGAGKTLLVKGIAEGNAPGSGDRVISPTFTLIHEYAGRLTLYHVDAYRLNGPNDLLALGFDELYAANAAVVVEWADRVAPAIPRDTLWISMAPTGPTSRSLAFSATGPTASQLLDALEDATVFHLADP